MKKIIKDKEGYGTVQRDFMQMDISVYAKCVYTLLRTYSGEKDSCYPSMKTICDDLKISKSTLIRAIKELENIEMVAVVRSKKKDSNENSVNTYIPLTIMVEIDISKIGRDNKKQELGGTPQTPRGITQTPGVVSEEYCKNNNIKNNIEEGLNINTEPSSVSESNDLFGGKVEVKTPAISSKKEKEKKEKTVREKIIEFWLKEFHVGWSFNSTDGKKVNSIINKLEKTLLSNGNEVNDESILNLFKAFCLKLPDFYKNETLSTLDSKYDSIIERIKQNNNGKQHKSNYNSKPTIRTGTEYSDFFSQVLRERSANK